MGLPDAYKETLLEIIDPISNTLSGYQYTTANDEVEIYDSALTGAEICQLHHDPVPENRLQPTKLHITDLILATAHKSGQNYWNKTL